MNIGTKDISANQPNAAERAKTGRQMSEASRCIKEVRTMDLCIGKGQHLMGGNEDGLLGRSLVKKILSVPSGGMRHQRQEDCAKDHGLVVQGQGTELQV